MDKITLSKMEFEGHTGCLDFEKTDGQKFIVSLDIFLDRIKGCYTDDLADTVDYAMIYEEVKKIVTEDKGNLIECLAQKVADCVLAADGRILKVIVNISKPEAPVKGIFETMAVTIERRRKEFVVLSLGSNLGDREANILAAEQAIRDLSGTEDFRYASIYETEPVGLEDQPYFLNTCVGFFTDIDPFELLDRIHVIENDLLRKSNERGEVLQNFEIRTSETAYMFMQHFIKMLKAGGRAGIVIKNTFLSNGDASAIRKMLLENCNLHTILDLPSGVFTGAGVKTVVLFFTKGEPTHKIWYYQVDKHFTKTQPLTEADMEEFLTLQKTKAESEHSWTLDVSTLDDSCDLSVKNPNKVEDVDERTPSEIAETILALEQENQMLINEIMEMVK